MLPGLSQQLSRASTVIRLAAGRSRSRRCSAARPAAESAGVTACAEAANKSSVWRSSSRRPSALGARAPTSPNTTSPLRLPGEIIRHGRAAVETQHLEHGGAELRSSAAWSCPGPGAPTAIGLIHSCILRSSGADGTGRRLGALARLRRRRRRPTALDELDADRGTCRVIGLSRRVSAAERPCSRSPSWPFIGFDDQREADALRAGHRDRPGGHAPWRAQCCSRRAALLHLPRRENNGKGAAAPSAWGGRFRSLAARIMQASARSTRSICTCLAEAGDGRRHLQLPRPASRRGRECARASRAVACARPPRWFTRPTTSASGWLSRGRSTRSRRHSWARSSTRSAASSRVPRAR